MCYLENNQKVNTYHEKHKEAALRILSPEMTTSKEQWAPPWILVPRFSKLDLPRCGLFQNCIFFVFLSYIFCILYSGNGCTRLLGRELEHSKQSWHRSSNRSTTHFHSRGVAASTEGVFLLLSNYHHFTKQIPNPQKVYVI